MLSGVILAGEIHDELKGSLPSLNRNERLTIINKHIKDMRSYCDEIIIVTNQPRALLPYVERDIRIITDYYKLGGPLCGIHAGLSLAKAPHVWVVSCDLPFISGHVIESIFPVFNEGKYHAIFPYINGTLHFYHSLYRKEIASIVEKAVKENKTHPASILDSIRWKKVNEDFFIKHKLDTPFITNAAQLFDIK